MSLSVFFTHVTLSCFLQVPFLGRGVHWSERRIKTRDERHRGRREHGVSDRKKNFIATKPPPDTRFDPVQTCCTSCRKRTAERWGYGTLMQRLCFRCEAFLFYLLRNPWNEHQSRNRTGQRWKQNKVNPLICVCFCPGNYEVEHESDQKYKSNFASKNNFIFFVHSSPNTPHPLFFSHSTLDLTDWVLWPRTVSLQHLTLQRTEITDNPQHSSLTCPVQTENQITLGTSVLRCKYYTTENSWIFYFSHCIKLSTVLHTVLHRPYLRSM